MRTIDDRVGELVEGFRRDRRYLPTPEGVPLPIDVATVGERLTAFAIDIGLMFGGLVALLVLLNFFHALTVGSGTFATLFLFAAFVLRTCYFLHFELAWQGRTPGKKACGLRVVNRGGGELTPGAVIARNLTREVEFFVPLSLFFSLDPDAGAWRQLALLGWVLVIASLPLWSRDRLRAGDLIGGTLVIAMPKRVLLPDLAAPRGAGVPGAFAFTRGQLAVYGAFELQVLEELLRRPDTPETAKLLDDVCLKIRRKIGWEGVVTAWDTRRFLSDFYAAERAELERAQLYGRLKADKSGNAAEGR